jgi:hypothetical protein
LASGSNGHVDEGCRTTHFSTLRISRQASAEHLEQCTVLPLRNRGLGPLGVTVLPIPLARRAAATVCAAVQSAAPFFSSLATGKDSRSWSALRTAGLSEIAQIAGFRFSRLSLIRTRGGQRPGSGNRPDR